MEQFQCTTMEICCASMWLYHCSGWSVSPHLQRRRARGMVLLIRPGADGRALVAFIALVL